ncbi:MAG: TIR domain-containing protein [Verrucomicrobia bacterium]|nr:MAG: TIR domain-containing protein [Verrucomicrobiota bacterium]
MTRYGSASVFIDFDGIPAGAEFREHLRKQLENCNLLLVIIDGNWIARSGSLAQEDDYVRNEIEIALERSIPMIPVLGNDAEMPKPDQLPPTIAELSYRNGARLRGGKDFSVHLRSLFSAIDEVVGKQFNPGFVCGQLVRELVNPIEQSPRRLLSNLETLSRILFNGQRFRKSNRGLYHSPQEAGSIRRSLARLMRWLISCTWEGIRLLFFLTLSLAIPALASWIFVLVAILPQASLPTKQQLAPYWPQIRPAIDLLREVFGFANSGSPLQVNHSLLVFAAAVIYGALVAIFYNMVFTISRLSGGY